MSVNERSGDIVKFIIYLVIVILLNIAAYTLFVRIDLTTNKAYSLSKVSRGIVSTLSEPLTINVFFTKNLPYPYNNNEKYLRDMLKEYAIAGNRHFNYKFYDVTPQEGILEEDVRNNQELATSFGIQSLQIQALEQDEIKFKTAYMGIAIIHGDMIEKIQAVTSTEKIEYQLTTAIQRLNNKISAFNNLKEKIKLKLFLSTSIMEVAPLMGLEGMSELGNKLDKIIMELNKKNYGKLEYIKLDPTKDTSLEEQVKKYDLVTLQWPEVPEQSIKSGHGSIGFIAEYGDKALEIPVLEILRIPIIGTQYSLVDMDVIGEVILKSIESLIDINENIGYLADHGSLSLRGMNMNIPGIPVEESVSAFNQLASQTYDIKEVRLEDRDILEGFNSLILIGPKQPFTDYELFQIDQFLMKGNNLALFLDSFEKVSDPGGQNMGHKTVETGLDKLLAHYGVSFNKSFVLDENCYKDQLPAEYGGGERMLYHVPIIKDEFLDKELPFMKNIRGLIAPESSPLNLDEEKIKENGLTVHKLFSSSERSWEMNQPNNLNAMMIQPPGPHVEMKSFPLALILEGEFTSYFAGKPVPQIEMKDDKNEGADGNKTENNDTVLSAQKIKSEEKKIEKGKLGKIFIVGTSGLLKNNVIDPEGTAVNAIFLMNLIDYLNGNEDIAVMRSKAGNLNPLATLSVRSKTAIKYFNIIGLPVIVALFGLVIWFYRYRRKVAIQKMFKK